LHGKLLFGVRGLLPCLDCVLFRVGSPFFGCAELLHERFDLSIEPLYVGVGYLLEILTIGFGAIAV
jgi:hypothetical protein